MNRARIDQLAGEIMERCEALARCSEEPGRITRTYCSEAMRDAHRLVSEWMKSAGMSPRVDAAGNLIGSYHPPGCDSERRVLIGSHLDSVVDAGRYDGVLGVMMGIAAVDALREAGTPLPWAIEVIGFSEEEGVRFGTPFLGSRALAGTLDAALLALKDSDGVTVGEALARFGAKPQAAQEVGECAIEQGSIVAYLEPHIEQGPLLELVREPIGVVTAIAGQTRMSVQWTGKGGHAGTAPMMQRHDPLVAASRWVLAVDDMGRATKGLAATVGRVEVEPNISNCIPRRVRASLDVRHADDAVRTAAVRDLLELAERLGAESRLTVRVEQDHEHAAIAMDAELTERLAAEIAAAGYEPQRLVSGAGHDAGVIATVAPSAMMFLRSPSGVSHHPDEAAAVSDVSAGLGVLVRFMVDLGRSDVESFPSH